MKPFYLIECEGVPEFNQYVSKFSFNESIEGDNVLSFSLGNVPPAMVDSDLLIKGKKVVFSFGYLGGSQTQKRIAHITDLEITESHTIDITVKALDLGQFFRKEATPKVWNATSSDIASQIANKYGLKTKIDSTSKQYKDYPQVTDDYTFLQKLAKEQANGDFMFWIADDVLHFRKIDLSENSQVTYTMRDGKILSFRGSEKTTETNGQAGGSTASTINPKTGEVEKVETKPDALPNNTKTGKENTFYDFGKAGELKK